MTEKQMETSIKENFKLLAIRPLKGCHKYFHKVLKTNKIYKFYDDFDFITERKDDKEEVVKIIHNPTVPEDFFHIKIKNKILPVNISAIVGKNGSGKSVLFELVFLSIYNYAVNKGILLFDENHKKLKLVPNVAVDIFYLIGEHYFKLHIVTGKSDDAIFMEKIDYDLSPLLNKATPYFEIEKDIRISQIEEKEEIYFDQLIDPFFYTIAINYSIHGLNSNQIGLWIKSLFHKNDGYQTPIVINPYRDKGIIDINVENVLAKQRLIANLLEPIDEKSNIENTLRCLAPGKIASKLVLKIDEVKIDAIEESIIKIRNNSNECLHILFEKYTGDELDLYIENEYYSKIVTYSLSKLVYICSRYQAYSAFIDLKRFKNIRRLADTFCADKSHVTFKLKQSFNFLKYNQIIIDKNYNYTKVDINELSEIIHNIKESDKTRILSTIELLPPPIFKINIELNDSSDFEDFSSGEKQNIHSLNSIIYHLINLNSVFKNGSDFLKEYKFINILFDEVELYFHPDFQRSFIHELLSHLEKINQNNIDEIRGVNICFATHSPFILSDIPSANILKLDKGEPIHDQIKTLGANIHDILSNTFFLKNGYMGKNIQFKINSLINYLSSDGESNDWNPEKALSFIKILDEPMLKDDLWELYNEMVFRNADEIDLEIEKLMKLRETRKR